MFRYRVVVLFRDLGVFRVEVDDLEVATPGRRLVSVLALLVARVGETVTADALIEATWGDSPPVRAVQALETVIWRLRGALEPGRSGRASGGVVQTVPFGYRLAVPPERVDSRRFMTQAREAADLLARGDFAAALELSESTLGLWRGEPYRGVAEASWIHVVRGNLSEGYVDLAECRVQALLQTGQPERAVREVSPLIADHPFRERFWAQRMLGLYRSGRQAAALDAFADARRVLADELGLDPGPELRRLHEQILAQVDALGQGAQRQHIVVGPPTTLPRRRGGLIGREENLAAITSLFSRHRLVTLVGMGGVGKTRLAVEVAHRLRDSYPDGVWFVDLTTLAVGAGAEDISDELAGALKLSPQPGITSPTLIVNQLIDRRLLIVFDTCEHVAAAATDLVDELLDRCPEATVLATSREPLDVAGGTAFLVEPLTEDAAAAFFVERLSNLRPDLDPEGRDRALIREICSAVGSLPLGIELAAARARVFELREVAASLAREPASLRRHGPGPARQVSLLDTVDWSYRLAPPDAQLLHRRLACLPGPVTLEAVRALCTAPLSHEQAPGLISGLVHQSLLSAIRPTRSDGPTLFRQLVPARAHAEGVLSQSERDEAETARDHWVVAQVRAAALDGRPGQGEASRWLEDNESAVRESLTSTLVSHPSSVGLELVSRLTLFWFERGRMVEAGRWFAAAAALPTLITLSDTDHAIALALQGCARALIQDRAVAEPILAAQLPRLVNPPQQQLALVGDVLVLIAVATWVSRLSRVGLPAATAAVAVGEQLDHPHVVVRARALQATHQLWLGHREIALPAINAVLDDPQGNQFAIFVAAYAASRAARESGDTPAAVRFMHRVAEAHQGLGMHPTSELLENLAHLLALTGAPAEAVRCLGSASALHARDGLPWPRQPDSLPLLDRLRNVVPAAEYEQLWAAGQRLGLGQPLRLLDEWLDSSSGLPVLRVG